MHRSRTGSTEILPWFGERVVPVDLAIAECWGRLSAPAKARGKPRPTVGALLAATAVIGELTIVTRNVTDYDGFGAAVLNPWECA